MALPDQTCTKTIGKSTIIRRQVSILRMKGRHHHQTVQQYVAASALDPVVMASAAEAVTGARTEAAQAVLEARTQVMEANAQFQSQINQLKVELSARDAALNLAGERENLLHVRMEECMTEMETLKANLLNQGASQNATGYNGIPN